VSRHRCSLATRTNDSAATHRTEKSSLQVPFTPSKNGESSNSAQGPNRPRSPGVAGLLSPAPLWHGTHIAGGSNGPGGGGGFHTHLVPPGLSNSPAHGHHQQGGYNTPHSMMRAFPDMAGASPNLQASEGQHNHEIPVSPMPMFNTANGEGMASIGLTPFTSGSEAATLPQVRRTALRNKCCCLLIDSSGQRCLGSSWMGIKVLPCRRLCE
jgi:hypothetical protein